MEPVCVSVNEAREALGVGRTKLYELINAGKLRVVRLGRRTLVSTESLRELAQGGADPRDMRSVANGHARA
jgi:excisionase family DNA binding protein